MTAQKQIKKSLVSLCHHQNMKQPDNLTFFILFFFNFNYFFRSITFFFLFFFFPSYACGSITARKLSFYVQVSIIQQNKEHIQEIQKVSVQTTMHIIKTFYICICISIFIHMGMFMYRGYVITQRYMYQHQKLTLQKSKSIQKLTVVNSLTEIVQLYKKDIDLTFE